MNGGTRFERLCYGREREPLEPYRRIHVLVRGTAWWAASVAALLLAVLSLLAAGRARGTVVEVVVGCFFGVLGVAVFASFAEAIVRPTPVALLPYDEPLP
jgi:hypothetical protein